MASQDKPKKKAVQELSEFEQEQADLAEQHADPPIRNGKQFEKAFHNHLASDEDQLEQQKCNADMALTHKLTGNDHFKANRHAEAIREYKQALELDATNANVHHNLGVCLDKLGRPAEAITSLTAAIHHKSDYGKAYARRGNLHMQQGNLEAAVQDYQMAVKWEPDIAAFKKEYQAARSALEKKQEDQLRAEHVKKRAEQTKRDVKMTPELAEVVSLLTTSESRESKPAFHKIPDYSVPPIGMKRIVIREVDSTKNPADQPPITEEMNVITALSSIPKVTDLSQTADELVTVAKVLTVATAKKTVDIPTPKTPAEFDRQWRAHQADAGGLFQLMKSIPAKSLPKLVGTRFDHVFLNAFFRLLIQQYLPGEERVDECLEALTSHECFDIVVSGLQSDLRKQLFDALKEHTGSSKAIQHDEVEKGRLTKLKKAYGVK